MRILHLHGGSIGGGAGKGVKILSDSLNKIGVRSDIISFEECGLFEKQIKIDKLINSWYKFAIKPNGMFNPWFYSVMSGGVGDKYDLINIHWMNGRALSPRFLSRPEKCVITLRDMWPFTGGCHYSIGCDRYKFGCGSCNKINSSNNFDVSKISAKIKKNYFNSNINVVGISNWITKCAAESYIMRDVVNFSTISNSIDTNNYYIDGECRDNFSIVVGAQSFFDEYKGFDDAAHAINLLYNEFQNITIHTFGDGDNEWAKRIKCKVVCHGYLKDVNMIRRLYSSCGVALFPSLYEAFGKTIAESIACGTPVVCYKGSGPDDIVDHKENGFLAQRGNVKELSEGLRYLISKNFDRNNISKSIIKKFSPENSALMYKKLYSKILGYE